jgi:hypothetical protein
LRYIIKFKYEERYLKISLDIMDISQYDIIVTRHAVLRAFERGVNIDTIEGVILNCQKQTFGKHYAKWVKKYDTIEIICIGYIENNVIRILTVETK